jgi:hypothetical protein
MINLNNIQPGQRVSGNLQFPPLSEGQNCCDLNYQAQCGDETITGSQELCITPLSELCEHPEAQARQQFWEGQGFSEVWGSTPTAAQVGNSGASYFNGAEFTNGIPLARYVEYADNPGDNDDGPLGARPEIVEFQGCPVIQVDVANGERRQFACRGHQLRDQDFDEVVFYMEFYNASPFLLDGISAGGRYQGRGVWWGGVRPFTDIPAGSNNRNDSWSVRSPYGANSVGGILENKDWLYVYPARLGTDTNSGDVRGFPGNTGGGPDKIPDKWQCVETHVKHNVDPNASDGLIQNFVDGQLTSEWAGRLRWFNNVYPRGFGVFFQLKGVDALVYIRNFKIFAK